MVKCSKVAQAADRGCLQLIRWSCGTGGTEMRNTFERAVNSIFNDAKFVMMLLEFNFKIVLKTGIFSSWDEL